MFENNHNNNTFEGKKAATIQQHTSNSIYT